MDGGALVTVRQVTTVEQAGHLVASVVLAFSIDPFVRWLFPGSDQYLTYFTQVTRLHGERTAANGGAYALTDGRGAAFWYPPGVRPDGEALGSILGQADVLDRLSSVWEQVVSHEPERPHWYLRQVGVDPTLQGSGSGSALMQAGLAEIDRQGELAYLEATSEGSRSFYERHGFTTLAEVQVGDAPPLWPMLRHAA